MDEYECNWIAYGFQNESSMPLWRKIITNAKNGQLRGDTRLEIVELESAFEVFAYDYVLTLLRGKGITQETINWISKRSVDELLSVWFQEATGKKTSKAFGTIHDDWSSKVKNLRDRVVHQGVNVGADEIKFARKAVFDYIVHVDNTTLAQFIIR